MARGPRYRVPFRRRREGKTNYYRRRELLKSGELRLVFRPTLSNAIAQFVKAELPGDRILVSAVSRELVKNFGWKASCGNLPAAYLTGLLAGLKARKAGIEKAILDAGIKKPNPGCRIYAGLKGVLDAGVNVPHDPECLPSEERIRGEHIASYWKTLSQAERERRFTHYLKAGLSPEELPKHFEEVKQAILKAYS
ncbi:MAG: 50S ribosomal protein L18 [Candidatus Hecatellales archaeon]|nr:MAG: 50S ribosomal protein L18 [Candidatus Hecatellales archaeon]